MEKQIKISEKAFINVLKLIWELDRANYQSDLKNAVEDDFNAKLDKIQKRIEYSKKIATKFRCSKTTIIKYLKNHNKKL